MEGVDSELLSSIGFSIGADGPVDGCGPFNDGMWGKCLGALSGSPGSYLNVVYSDAVRVLMEWEDWPITVFCFTSEGDDHSAQTCNSATGETYEIYTFSGGEHGVGVIQPGIEPNALEKIKEFLVKVYGLD